MLCWVRSILPWSLVLSLKALFTAVSFVMATRRSFTHSAVARWGESTARALRAAQAPQQRSCQERQAVLPSVLNSTYKTRLKHSFVPTNVPGSCWLQVSTATASGWLWPKQGRVGWCGRATARGWQGSPARSPAGLRNTL